MGNAQNSSSFSSVHRYSTQHGRKYLRLTRKYPSCICQVIVADLPFAWYRTQHSKCLSLQAQILSPRHQAAWCSLQVLFRIGATECTNMLATVVDARSGLTRKPVLTAACPAIATERTTMPTVADGMFRSPSQTPLFRIFRLITSYSPNEGRASIAALLAVSAISIWADDSLLLPRCLLAADIPFVADPGPVEFEAYMIQALIWFMAWMIIVQSFQICCLKTPVCWYSCGCWPCRLAFW